MSSVLPLYPFDPTGNAESNKVSETQAILSRGMLDHYYVIPRCAPFYAESVRLRLYPAGTNSNNPAAGQTLDEGVHYNFGYHFAQASHTIGKPIYGAISFYDRTLTGQLRMEYQTVGGEWVLDDQGLMELLANTAHNPRIATWEQVVALPIHFPVVNHDFNIDDFVGMGDVVDMLEDIGQAIVQKNEGGVVDHIGDTNNPHNVTKEQVGLGLVDNYPVATIGEATAGLANNRYMTPQRTRQLIDAVATYALNLHLVDFNNPHQVTKAQIGLGNVQNYATATQAEAEAGASNARYMTPQRTREAIDAIVGMLLTAHINDRTNPHGVTKAQVGLGNVPNIGLATDLAALEGIDNASMLSPRHLRMVLNETVMTDLHEHTADFANPHGVTKAQIGLGNVQNFGIASDAEASEGVAADRYMTPRAVRQAINALVGGSSNAHMIDFANPHKVTAAQVGTYDKAGIDALLLNKIGLGDTAADTAKAFGMDQATFQAWVNSQAAADSLKFDGKTYTEVKDDILAGTAADAALLAGKDYETIVNEVTTTVGGSLDELTSRLDDLEVGSSMQANIPGATVIKDAEGTPVPVPVHWVKLGEIIASESVPYADVSLIVSSSRFMSEYQADHRYTVLMQIGGSTLDMSNPALPDSDGGMVKALTPGEAHFTLGYSQVGSDISSTIEVYARIEGPYHRIDTTELSFKRFTPAEITPPSELTDLITEEPVGIRYLRTYSEGSSEILALQQFTARTDNPHQVSKAQVGLGNVQNFGIASEEQALAGVASDRYMTPSVVAAKVNQELDAVLGELAVIFSDGATVFE